MNKLDTICCSSKAHTQHQLFTQRGYNPWNEVQGTLFLKFANNVDQIKIILYCRCLDCVTVGSHPLLMTRTYL